MNLVEFLPQFLQNLRPEARRKLERQLETLFSPLVQVDTRMRNFLTGILTENLVKGFAEEALYLQLTAMGLQNNLLDEVTLKRLNPQKLWELIQIFPLYAQQRGTRDGLALLLNWLLPGMGVSIEERRFPWPAVRIGTTRLFNRDDRLLHDDSEARSLIITIEASRESIEDINILYSLLKNEIPVGHQAFVNFHPDSPCEPKTLSSDWFNLGETL